MNTRLDINVGTAGSMLWLAPHELGGHSPNDLGQAWMGTPQNGVTTDELIKKALFVPYLLVQGDSFYLRWVVGDLNPQEEAEWIARSRVKVSVPCGKLMAVGVLTPDFASMEYPTIQEAKAKQTCEFGGYIKVKPGEYEITVHSFLPMDLTGAQDALSPDSYEKNPAIEPEELAKYFKRTRPGTPAPAWIEDPGDETPYVQFLVQVKPLSGTVPPLKLDESGGAPWEFRKPKICPLGIRAEL